MGEREVAYQIQSKTRELLRGIDEADNDAESHLQPDRDFEVKGRVVKVSTFVTAVHLMVAKWAVQGFPNVIKDGIVRYAKGTSARVIAKRALKSVVEGIPGAGTVAGLAGDVVESASQESEMIELETKLRALCAEVRKDFNEHAALSQAKKKGRRKVVKSRHQTAKKKKRKSAAEVFAEMLSR